MADLSELLESWRETHAIEIADAIDAMSVVMPDELDHAAWLALAKDAREEDVPTLLAHLLDAGVSTLSGRLEVLCDRPADPRVTMKFAELALDPPTTASSNFSVWTQLLAYLKRAADPRVLPLVKKRLAMDPGASKFWPKLYTGLEKVVAATKPAAKLDAAEAKKVKAAAKTKAVQPPKKKAPAATSTQSPVEPTLAGAVIAADRGDLLACLDALLAVWRARRLAAVGDAIDRVSRILTGGLPPIPPKQWSSAASTRTAADIGRLAESAADGKPGDAEKRMDELLGWPPDPRVGEAFLVLAYTRFWSDRQRAWKLTTDLIVRNADRRFLDAANYFAEPTGDNKARMANMRRLSRELPAALADVPAAPSPADESTLAELDAAITKYLAAAPMTEDKLLADIAAAPDDDGPRLVYADWLTERGHPRGELIVLGCGQQTPESKKRIDELQREHARALLGPATAYGWNNYGYVLQSGMAVFSRGLLRYLEFRFPTPGWLVSSLGLMSVMDEADVHLLRPEEALTLLRKLPRIKTLRDIGLELFAELCAEAEPLAIESVRVAHVNEANNRLESRALQIGGRGLANLRSLELYWADTANVIDHVPACLLSSPSFAKVEHFGVGTTQLGSVLESLARHGRKVKRLSFLRRYTLNFRVDVEDGVATVLPLGDFAVELTPPMVETLRAVVASLPEGTKVTTDPRITLASPL